MAKGGHGHAQEAHGCPASNGTQTHHSPWDLGAFKILAALCMATAWLDLRPLAGSVPSQEAGCRYRMEGLL